jgi:starch-binding outer membrane protein, SusD/RagB family
MNTHKIYKWLIFFIVLASLSACSEEFLEVERKGAIPQEDFYETDDDALGAVVASYDMLQTIWALDWQSAWMVKVLPGDEVNCGGGNASDQPPYQRLNKFTYGPNNRPISDVYNFTYYGILRANKVIEQVEPDTEAKKIIIAEARTLRAFYYFELVTMFGKVPLVTQELEVGNYAQAPAPESDIWAQIEKDLNDAIPELLTKSELIGKYGSNHAFRVTKGTAQALLGKAHLYQEEWSAAATQLQAVIDSKEYILIKDFSKIFRKETEFGSESLFEISYTTEQNNQWSNFKWGQGRLQENNIHWQLCGPRDFNGGNTGLLAGWGFANPKQILLDAYAEEDSIRRKATLMTEEELIAQGGNWRDAEGNLPYESEGIIRLKYGQWKDETNMSSQPELNYGTNIRLIRMADVYLMAAEAYHHSGNNTAAHAALDSITNRAQIAQIRTTGDDLLADIKHQRRVELAFEGHRFADLVRWGDAPIALSYKGYAPKYALYPIPQNELDLNPKMEQSALWK